jgi:Ca-activated chloride channel family protein
MRRLWIMLAFGIPLAGLATGGETGLGHILFAVGEPAAAARLLHDSAWEGYLLAKAGRYQDAAAAFGDAPATAFNKGNALALAHHFHEAIDAYDDALDADPEDEDARFNKDLVVRLLAGGAVDAGPSKTSASATANKEHHGKASDETDGETSSSGNGYAGHRAGASSSGPQGNSKVAKAGAGNDASSDASGGKATGSASAGSGVGRSGGNLADALAAMRENQRRVLRDRVNGYAEPSVEWLQTLHDDPGEYLKLMIRAEQQRRAAHTTVAEGDGD